MELLLIPLGVLLGLLYVGVGFFVTYFISGLVDELPPLPVIPILTWPFTIVFFVAYALVVEGWNLLTKTVGGPPTPVGILTAIGVKSYALGLKIRKRFAR